MPQILVWKSVTDGKLFEDKSKYIGHLRKIAAIRRQDKCLAKLEAEREVFVDQMGLVSSIADLNRFIKVNWKWFYTNGLLSEGWRLGKGQTPEFHEYVDVYLSGMRWSEAVSNSHSAPRKGVTNFDTRADCNKDKPTGYPGWIGRIDIKVRPPMKKYQGKEYIADGWGSSYFNRTTINTGGGGGGGGKNHKSYSYDVRIFAADFPVMHEIIRRKQWIQRENEERQRAWGTLGGAGKITLVTQVPDDWTCPDPMIGIG